MTDNRERLLAKIKALLAKTVENGCTEAEQMAALGKAQAMMDAYDVTEEDLEDAKKDEAVHAFRHAHDPHSVRTALCTSVARFTGTESFKSRSKRYHTCVSFIGTRPDVEFAGWLLDHLTAFVQRELTQFCLKTPAGPSRADRRVVVNGFVFGILERVVERLNALCEASEVRATENKHALVVIQTALIQKKIEDMGIKFRVREPRSRMCGVDAREAGREAGDRATFNRPVGEGGSVALIGGKK